MNTPMAGPEFAAPHTIGALLTAIDQKVGALEPTAGGMRGANFHSHTRRLGDAWLHLRQTPIQLSDDRSVAFINYRHANKQGSPYGDYLHYNFYPTETGVDLVESNPGLMTFDHIDSEDYPDMASFVAKTLEESRRIRAEERAAGLGGVTEIRAQDLLRAIRRAKRV